MHSPKRSVLTAALLGLSIAASVSTHALAHVHHPGRHAANPPDALADDPALPPYPLASDDAQADEALGIAPTPARAAARSQRPSGIAGELAHWVAATDDNGELPFMIVDKLGARVFAFDADGRFLGSAPALVGLARGDDSAPGIGGLKLSQISADERTTPAGRFVSRWADSDGHGVMLWVDYADAISMHPVMSVNAGEHRLERIKSADPEAHRISYGCINVPKAFYDAVVLTALAGGDAVVYVLPDTKPVEAVFPAFAAASGENDAEEDAYGRRSRKISSAELLTDAPGGIPAPRPSQFDLIDEEPPPSP